MQQLCEPDPSRRIRIAAPDLTGNEEAYVVEAVRSGWVSSTGAFIDRFEREFAARCGTRHAVACSSGTTGLHLALATLGAGRGDEVIVPATTFVASANAVRFCRATPVFVDIDPETWCLDPRGVVAAIGPKTVGIMPVHLLGHPADMDAINAIAAARGLWVVEDAAEAAFATYRGRPVGSLSDASAFSFFGNKIMTSGEGGAVTFSRDDLLARMRMLRNHGLGPARRYHARVVGFNYRMSNLAAAVACAQLERCDTLLARRRAILRLYDELLRGQPGLLRRVDASWAGVSPWLVAITVDRDIFGLNRDDLAAALAARGIETRPLFPPLHRMRPYRRLAIRQGIVSLPVAERLGETGLMLPTHPLMTDDDVAYVCESIAAVGRGHARRRTA